MTSDSERTLANAFDAMAGEAEALAQFYAERAKELRDKAASARHFAYETDMGDDL